MNFLIVKCAALGDVLRTTSLLRPLKARYPDCRIAWVTTAGAKPLLENNPWIDKILSPPQAKRSLRKDFDLVLSMEEDAEAARIAQASCRGELIGIVPQESGARKNRLRYTPSSAPYYDMSLLNRGADGGLAAANRLKSENRLGYAELWLKILDIPLPMNPELLRPVLELKPRDRKAAGALLRKHRFSDPSRIVGLNPGAGRRWPAKQLSEEKAIELLTALHARSRQPVFLFGGKDETARNKRILKRTREIAIDVGTGHDLRSFAGLIDLCDALVTTDSLTFHIATALGKTALVLVGPTSAAELDVFGKGAKITPPDGCSCFYKPRCTQATHCLDQISIEDIVRNLEI